MAKASTLVDNFNDDSTGAQWTIFGNPAPISERIREINGRVEIYLRSGETGAYSGYRSTALYDLTQSAAHVELVRALRQAAGAVTQFSAANASGSIYFSVENGALTLNQLIASTHTELLRLPYDPRNHRWLRFHEQSGALRWEVSPDSVAWTALLSGIDPIPLNAVKLVFQAGLNGAVPSPGIAVFDNFNVLNTAVLRRVEERRLSAEAVREEAAELAAERLHPEQVNNNDEVNYAGRPFIGNFSKSLKHDSLGDPDPVSYGSLLRALESRDPHDFEEIQLGQPASGKPVKLTNPQAGLAFDLEGPDAQEPNQLPAPRFDSEQTAHEAGELYWMAAARDVPFINWASQATTAGTVIKAAIDSLNSEFPAFGGTRPVTAQNLFRGIFPGEQIGPYISQFLVKGNVDPRKPAGVGGTGAADGFVSYGAQGIDQRLIVGKAGTDYLLTFTAWLDIQNGLDKRGLDQFQKDGASNIIRRFISTLRDGATYVHFDQVLNAFYNTAWYLMSEPIGDQLTNNASTGHPQIDMEFPWNPGNPYDPAGTTLDSKTQAGFGTFGPIHLLQVLGEALGRAIRAVWWQKWGVHRRLRPEEYGGRVYNQITNARTYPLHASILNSLQSGRLSAYYGAAKTFPTVLLPQAYPEGAPTHPAYGAGHATGVGAMATVLKAFFDESTAIKNPLQAGADCITLVPYTGADASQMTVGSELNKLAGNIALFRNAAGVHWRSDYTESLLLGEGISIRLLQEASLGFNEDDAYFEFTRFDGQKIRIFDGQVVAVP